MAGSGQRHVFFAGVFAIDLKMPVAIKRGQMWALGDRGGNKLKEQQAD